MKRAFKLGGLAIVLSAALAFAGCAEDDSDSGTTTASTASDSTDGADGSDATDMADGADATDGGESFCESYVATCGEWSAETACADWWSAAAEGTEGDAAGATKACYTYHLGVAAEQTDEAMKAAHCAHAMGGADADGNAPCTDPEMTFCEKYVATCGEWTAETPCADWWSAAAEGSEGDAAGATQGCYSYHLGVAADQTDEAMKAAHCAHAMGGADTDGNAPCTDAN